MSNQERSVFTADGAAPITVNWNAPVTRDSTRRLEFVYSSPVPAMESLPQGVEGAPFDDYVVVFPTDSGLDPVYVMFRSRVEYPV
ncbi:MULTISPECIES: S-type pyocin domain-containing protein [unclassified Pseudomonas]|jgi:hypothetical protein|uniref:S-type pyocin domain-containing protein n=1 Tax=Pseudomonas sp. A-R-26 TaxID=2832404 RepID=UPI001CBBD784|nr:S-type pyocin domain-containing protein [Pseudomonas sp. A-R-26]